MKLSVRAFTIEDYPQGFALWQRCDGIGLSVSDEAKPIAEYLKRNEGLSAVAIADGKLVGAVLCGHDGRRGYLHHLAVDADYRRRGIARQMLNFCLDRLSAIGIPKCNLFLFDANEEGAKFWLHNGWIRRSDLLVLQKVLR